MRKRRPKTSDAPPASLPTVTDYTFGYLRGPEGGRDLVVVFSPGGGFSFFRHQFSRDALFVADSKLSYYLREPGNLAAAIVDFIEQGCYERVLFLGSSKAGFGAISTARLCARRKPGRTFHVIAFSPQISLYPQNDSLHFASYAKLMRRAAKRDGLASVLRRLGDAADAAAEGNLAIRVVYARRSEGDRAEALRLQGRNVTHHVVEGATHGTAFHFIAHGLDRDALRARIERAYLRIDDMDLLQTRPADMDEMVDEVMASALREPTLNVLIDEVLSRRPSPTAFHWLAAMRRKIRKARAARAGKMRSPTPLKS